MQDSLFVAFLIGLTSNLHCVAMCGGISGALTLSLPQSTRGRRFGMFLYSVVYSLGRVASYTVAGSLSGSAGRMLADSLYPQHGLSLLRIFAALMVIAIGFYLAGWFPRFATLESIGEPLWRRLEPIGRRLLLVRSLLQALAYGIVWGWLPCGLVYWALFIAASTGDAVDGGLFMAMFGVGTLPGVIATGMLSGWIQQMRGLRYVNQAAGLLLILLACTGIWFATEFQDFFILESKD